MNLRFYSGIFFLLLVLIIAGYIDLSSAADASHPSTAGLWQYQGAGSNQPNASPFNTHNDYATLGQRQTSLSSPLVSFLPMLVLFGIGAVIVISILYFIFNPFGLTSLMSPAAYGPASYGRKRSLDQFPLQSYIIELVTQVTEALEKYDKPIGTAGPPSSSSGKHGNKKNS